MLDKNFGFSGNIPDGVSIENNIKEALEYKNTHNEIETLFWFREKVGNNKDERLIPQSESMDYKQIDSKYAEFGNFNYGAVGTALGYPSEFLKLMAGAAQLISDKEATNWLDAVPKASILENYGDNLEDQIVIQFGIKSANSAGFNNTVDEFIENINNLTQIQQNKYEAWESLSPEKKAEWIKSGKFPWDYEEDASPTDWNNANDPSITEEETNTINDYLSDLKALTEEKTAHWLTDGGIEDEWDDYVSAMDSMGLQDVVAAWQAAYDRYVEAQ